MTDDTPASNEPEPDPPERAPADDIALLHEAIRLAIALVLERGEDRATANDVGLRAGTKFWEARAAGVYDPAQPLGPYMATIVRNLLGEDQRRDDTNDEHAAFYQRDIDGAQRDWMNPESPLMEAEAREFFYKALDRVPPVCREVFLLDVEQHLSDKDIARLLDIAEKTVRAHKHHARVRLANTEFYSYLKEAP